MFESFIDMKFIQVSEFVFLYFKSTLLFMRYFGLAPFTFELRRKNSILLKLSLKWTIYSFSFIFLLAIVVALTIFRDIEIPESNKTSPGVNILGFIIRWVDEGGVTFIVLYSMALGRCKLQHLFHLLGNFDKIQIRLSHTNSSLKHCKRNSGITIVTSFCVVFLILIFDFWAQLSSVENTEESLFRKVYYNIAFYIYYITMISQLIAYCTIMHFIEKNIRALNYEIVLKIQRNYRLTLSIQNDITNLRKSFPSKNTKLKNGKNQYETGISADEIRDLMTIHEKIHQSVISINQLFGYFLLFILINCLIQIVYLSWSLFTNYKNDEKDDRITAFNIIWLVFAVCRLFLVIEPSHRCLQEYDKIVHNVIRLLKSVDDILVRKEVEIFVHQVQLLTVDFTSADIVYLRRSLLASITSAVTTYLVILIQFTPNNS